MSKEIVPIGNHSGNKYVRVIDTCHADVEAFVEVDVYCVLEAFNVTCPALQHAIKKLLCAGIRGKGDFDQDIKEAVDALQRARVLQEKRSIDQN